MIKAISDYLINTRNHLLVLFLIIIGFAVRGFEISDVPSGLNQDEASIGYETFSIMTSGCDRNANLFPVHLVSWGNGQNALYAYLSIPFIHFFGLNVFSVRIVNLLFSCLSLLIFYSLFKSIFDKKKALTALALLSICPWSIMSARWGLESNIFPTLFLLAVFFLIKGTQTSQRYFLASFFVFAISLYSYGTSYLIIPLFFSLTIPYLLHKKRISLSYLLLSLTLFLFVALPIVAFVIINHLNLHQVEIAGITIPRLDTNRTVEIFNLFNGDFAATLIRNLVRFLSIIVLQTDGNEYNAISSIGTIYFISFPFFLVGVFSLFKNKQFLKETHHFIFSSWLLCSIILGITCHVNINRLNIIFIPMLYFTLLGIFNVGNMLKSEYRRGYSLFLTGLYTITFGFFCGYYFIIFKEDIKNDFSYGLGDAIQYAERINHHDSINITTQTINMPYIYVCFYNQPYPTILKKTIKYEAANNTGFRKVYSLGRYTFNSKKVSKSPIRILDRSEIQSINTNNVNLKSFGNYFVVH